MGDPRVFARVRRGAAGPPTQTAGNGTDFERVFKLRWLLVCKPGQRTKERLFHSRAFRGLDLEGAYSACRKQWRGTAQQRFRRIASFFFFQTDSSGCVILKRK